MLESDLSFWSCNLWEDAHERSHKLEESDYVIRLSRSRKGEKDDIQPMVNKSMYDRRWRNGR